MVRAFHAQAAFNGLLERIAQDPWDFQPWNNPAGNMRQAAFGEDGQGLAVFVIVDRDERLVVIKAVWLH